MTSIKIQSKASAAALPRLSHGELGYAEDTKELYIGTVAGVNEKVLTSSGRGGVTYSGSATLYRDAIYVLEGQVTCKIVPGDLKNQFDIGKPSDIFFSPVCRAGNTEIIYLELGPRKTIQINSGFVYENCPAGARVKMAPGSSSSTVVRERA